MDKVFAQPAYSLRIYFARYNKLSPLSVEGEVENCPVSAVHTCGPCQSSMLYSLPNGLCYTLYCSLNKQRISNIALSYNYKCF